MRKIIISSTPEFLTDRTGAEIRVMDAETGRVMVNVQAIGVSVSVDDMLGARIVCLEMEGDKFKLDDEGRLIEYEEDVSIQAIHVG